jgi:ComF family protein
VAGRWRVVFSSSKSLSPGDGATVLPRRNSLVSSLATGVSNVANALFATFFPGDCRLCGNPLINISQLPVCDPCLSSLNRLDGVVCSICGERLTSPYALSAEDGAARCGLCQRAQPPYVKAAAYGSYESGLREFIHLLKYDQVRPAAAVLGRMLGEAIGDLPFNFSSGPIVVVPVPLYVRKFRQRGFNQSELIARSALKLFCAGGGFELNTRALERQRETQSQIGLSRHQRRVNMRGAFVVTEPDEIAGREVLLVDDVLTTGTTASECARVLRKAGASKIYVATVARTLKAEAQSARTVFAVDDAQVMAAHG